MKPLRAAPEVEDQLRVPDGPDLLQPELPQDFVQFRLCSFQLGIFLAREGVVHEVGQRPLEGCGDVRCGDGKRAFSAGEGASHSAAAGSAEIDWGISVSFPSFNISIRSAAAIVCGRWAMTMRVIPKAFR